MSAAAARRLAQFGLILTLAAACRAAPSPMPSANPTVAPTTELTATVVGTPWILVDAAASSPVYEAVAAWAETAGRDVEARSLNSVLEGPPPDLWAVVGLEENLKRLADSWPAGEVAFVVLDPTALAAGGRMSTLGPGLASDQAGFLAGVATGLATQSGVVGVTSSADEVVDWRMGFEEGLLYSCPKCQLESIADLEQPASGVDVVALAPGGESPSGAPAVGAPWLVVLGAAPDGWVEHVAARVRVAPEALVGPALDRLSAGEEGSALEYAAGSGLVTEVNARAISPGRERLVREAEAHLADGSLVVGGGS